MLDESTSIYHSCLSRLNESTWKEKDSCRPILSYLFTLLIHSGKEWRTRSRQCEYIFRVFIGSFGSKEKEESLSLTEMMMIRNKLHKLTAERTSMIWNVGEEMQHFSVLACHLMFELLLGGVEKAKDTLHTLEDDVLESRRKNEGNNLVYSIVLVKLRQLMCLFVFLDWHYSHQLGLRTVRNVLEEALEKYPGDELLLFMYSTLFRLYANDSMESSLRVTFSRLLYQSNASVMTVIAHIVAENGSLLEQESNDRKETNLATWRRIKSLLARSLYETSLACSSLLWIQYLTVLYTERNSDRNSSEVLKRAFYRALTHIPYSKELVLKAFMLLAETLTIREAKDIWSITREKGILFKKNFPYSGDE